MTKLEGINLAERLTRVETKVDGIRDELQDNKQDHTEIKTILKDALNTKANRWVETAFWWVVTILTLTNAVAIYLAITGR